MATMLFVFVWLGVFIAIAGICEEVLPAKLWDKLAHILKFD